MVGSIVRWECVSDLEGNCAFVVGVIVVRDFVVGSGVRMADMWRTAVWGLVSVSLGVSMIEFDSNWVYSDTIYIYIYISHTTIATDVSRCCCLARCYMYWGESRNIGDYYFQEDCVEEWCGVLWDYRTRAVLDGETMGLSVLMCCARTGH